MKRLIILAFVCTAFADEFKELSKSEAKEFARAADGISESMTESRFAQIRAFGPGILKQYASIQIQSDSYAKKLREAYQRCDSILAYTVLRLMCDSLSQRIEPAPSFEMTYSSLIAADKIHSTLLNPLMKVFHPEYADSMSHFTEDYITKLVPTFSTLAKQLGRPDQAAVLLNALSFKPPMAEKTRYDINASIRKAFYDAMASNNIESLEVFSQRYPDYELRAIQDRIEQVRGDEIAYLLKKGSREELVSFLVKYPGAKNAKDIRRKLKPLLYRFAENTQDPLACQQFLSLFPEPSFEKSAIQDLVNQLSAEARALKDSVSVLSTPAQAQ